MANRLLVVAVYWTHRDHVHRHILAADWDPGELYTNKASSRSI